MVLLRVMLRGWQKVDLDPLRTANGLLFQLPYICHEVLKSLQVGNQFMVLVHVMWLSYGRYINPLNAANGLFI